MFIAVRKVDAQVAKEIILPCTFVLGEVWISEAVFCSCVEQLLWLLLQE